MPKFMRHLDDSIPAGEGSQATVVIRGAGFGEEKPALQVEVNKRSCHVTALNQTEVVCQVPRLPVGIYPVTLLVTPHGFALNGTTGQGIFLAVEPALGAVEPPSTSEIGRCGPSKGAASCFFLVMACFGSSALSLLKFSPDEEDISWLDTLCVPQSTVKNFLKTDRLPLALCAGNQFPKWFC